MDKLQKALEKARHERKARISPDPAAGPAPQGTTTTLDPTALAAEPLDEKARVRTRVIRPTMSPAWEALPGLLPDPNHFLQNRIMTLQPRPEATPFDILRTKVFLMMQQNNWTRLAIISPDKGCGKSTLACNLAVGFTRQPEVNVALLDMDLRQPSVGKMLGHTPKEEFKEVLIGNMPPEQQVVRLAGNLAIAASKHSVQDPSQVLLSGNIEQVFDDIQTHFALDVMLLDLPPMLATDDARAVLKHVDCALIVSRADHTRVGQLDTCEREVAEHTNVVGITLNDCRHMDGESSYDYSND